MRKLFSLKLNIYSTLTVLYTFSDLAEFDADVFDQHDGIPDKILSLDSASARWIRQQCNTQLATDKGNPSLPDEKRSHVPSRPLLTSTVSCPALSTPSITVRDYSTTVSFTQHYVTDHP